MDRIKLIVIFISLSLFFFQASAQKEKKIAITHGPYLQSLSETSVIITWTTNRTATAWVELVPNDSTHFYKKERPKFFSAEYGFKDVGKIHSVKLQNLEPGTTYRYRIYSKEVLKHEGTKVLYGGVAATKVLNKEPLSFTTHLSSKEDVSFVIINDIHGNNDMMSTLLKVADVKSSDCVFFNGDMVNSLNSEEQMFGDFVDTAVKEFAKEIPMYYARGNHETRGSFASEFPKYFSSDSGKLYYLLRIGEVCFVVLDCGEDKPDSDIEYSGIVAFDQYREIQKEWLKVALESDEYKSAAFKLAIVHMPPFGDWHGEEEIARQFVPLLDDAKIDVMLCGHLHRYVKQEPQPGIGFPVIVNSNNTVLRGELKGDELEVKILNLEGAVVDKIVLEEE